MYSVLRKSLIPAKGLSRRALSDSAFVFEKGSKVSLMGTNTARASTLGAIEKANSSAVRLASIPQNAHSSTVAAYLQKHVPEGANVQKALEEAKLGSRLGSTTVGGLTAAERTRLQLAIASLQTPEVLLIDQPTAAPADSTFTLDDVQVLSDMIAKYPKTCVINSSDTSFLDNFSNTVLHILPDGNTEQLYGSYSAAQDTLAARYEAASGPRVVTMSFTEKAGWFALLVPIEVLIFWSMTYAGK
mmetsp:Transcript_799/g.1377  ORF Transcript_799/g.1377 Transcript_799/m.1377 type:complete len:244 (-) Transcript_799:184-915(-)